MATPTELLRSEHEVILQVAGALEALLDAGTGSLELDSIGECITFIRLFADACHHNKEEDLLFPELEARGMPREGGPIAVMLDEHEQGRALVRKMVASLPAAQDGDAAALQGLESAGRGFIDLIRNHIFKENNILFPMADRAVDDEGCRKLCAGYDEVATRSFEGHSRAELLELAARLAQKHVTA